MKKKQSKPVPKEVEATPLESIRMSDKVEAKKTRWTNRQRVLVFAARGINHRDRHLMRDIKSLMPHHRTESKMERSKTLSVVNEICEIKHCNKALLFEGRRKQDLYMWAACTPNGPSVKFLVENIHTMGELKMAGNCLRGSRPLLSFDMQFKQIAHLSLIKEMLTQTFGVPNHHPKSQPFYDNVYTFTYLDNRIWFRNFQILSEDGGLSEIGPRFVLNPIKVFEDAFTGKTMWENTMYVSPTRQRQEIKKAMKNRYVNQMEQKVHREVTRPTEAYKFNQHDDIFEGKDPIKKATEYAVSDSISKQDKERKERKNQLKQKLKKKKAK